MLHVVRDLFYFLVDFEQVMFYRSPWCKGTLCCYGETQTSSSSTADSNQCCSMQMVWTLEGGQNLAHCQSCPPPRYDVPSSPLHTTRPIQTPPCLPPILCVGLLPLADVYQPAMAPLLSILLSLFSDDSGKAASASGTLLTLTG